MNAGRFFRCCCCWLYWGGRRRTEQSTSCSRCRWCRVLVRHFSCFFRIRRSCRMCITPSSSQAVDEGGKGRRSFRLCVTRDRLVAPLHNVHRCTWHSLLQCSSLLAPLRRLHSDENQILWETSGPRGGGNCIARPS